MASVMQRTVPDVERVIERLLARAAAADYAGFDPYDALESPVLRRLTRRSKWLRIAVTQLLRRSLLDVRRLLAVRPGHNTMALGLFLGGLAKLSRVRPGLADPGEIQRLLDRLEAGRSTGYSGNCWGYNFDWQSRTAYRPAGTPTVVNTAFVGHALLDCHELMGDGSALDLAVPIKDFILNDLHRTPLGDAFCFSYSPVDREVVHNANMLGASILIRLRTYCDDRSMEDAALASLDYSMRHQHGNGAWYYADRPGQRWIDSFHTGFNLQALRVFLDHGYALEHRDAFDRGVRFYAGHFFLADGTPRYYHDRTFPIDIHAPAQAVAFFAGMGDDQADRTDRVLGWMLRHLYDGRGRFYFRKTRAFTNRNSYMRWCQAWAFHALTEYLFRRAVCGGEAETW